MITAATRATPLPLSRAEVLSGNAAEGGDYELTGGVLFAGGFELLGLVHHRDQVVHFAPDGPAVGAFGA